MIFHQTGGSSDGSSPMCFPLGEFRTGDSDVFLGEIGDTPFYMSKDQYEYWKHTQLIIDVVEGRGGMFSLEGPEGKRFLTRSRVRSEERRVGKECRAWAWRLHERGNRAAYGRGCVL